MESSAAQRKAQVGASLKEFQAREVERILSACTACGKCYEVCPMARYSAAPESDGKRGGSRRARRAARRAGQRRRARLDRRVHPQRRMRPGLPESVDPRMMMRLARMTALGGRGLPKQIDTKEDRDYFDRVRAFALLQLSDEERKDWT